VFIVKKIVVDYKYHLRYYVVKNSSRNYIYSLSGFVTPPIYVYRLNNDSEFYAMLKPRTVLLEIKIDAMLRPRTVLLKVEIDSMLKPRTIHTEIKIDHSQKSVRKPRRLRWRSKDF